MKFYVAERHPDAPQDVGPEAYLIPDNWNDWWRFRTQYSVYLFDSNGALLDLGSVKIGREGLEHTGEPNYETNPPAKPDIPPEFEKLESKFFSLGQSENYYETLRQADDDTRKKFLKGMRDCAYNLKLFEKYGQEQSMRESLLRDVGESRVLGRYNRLAHGDATLSPYKFTYLLPVGDPVTPTSLPLGFDVRPHSMPPTNVHVLIGRNGVGKTRALDLMSHALSGIPLREGSETGRFVYNQDEEGEADFSFDVVEEGEKFGSLVIVSFSAFDKFDPTLQEMNDADRFNVYYVGLKGRDNDGTVFLKDREKLTDELIYSAEQARIGRRRDKWHQCLRILEADPMFEENGLSDFAGENFEGSWLRSFEEFLEGLSSGHMIVLLITTRLVHLVEEKTLVLIDEPEGHLHPPLLSAFVRALSTLLTRTNGVAIIATHSPVVLQEVPRSAVWTLNRSGRSVRADRPDVETFGENVGSLTREVFGLEVRRSGYHRLLEDYIFENAASYDEVRDRFDDQLGSEARALARAIIVSRDGSETAQ